MTKWDNDSFDRAVGSNGKPIKRIGNYVNYESKIQMKCLNCEHEWYALPGNLIRLKVGCPKCVNNLRLTNEIIDKRLESRTIERVEDYKNARFSMLWRCKICNHEWRANADGIMNSNKGCGKCKGGSKLPDEYYLDRLKNKNIVPLEPIVNSNKRMRLKCLVCNNVWMGMIGYLCRKAKSSSGCPTCLYKREAFVGKLIKKHLPYARVSTHVPLETPKRNFNVDFVINDTIFVEYNGEHHYIPVSYGGNKKRATEELNKRKNRDMMLRDYCQKNSITLVEIPYTYSDEKIEETIITIKSLL